MTDPSKPPFRSDHVGSLLRPPELAAARQKWKSNELSAEELRAVEDASIRHAVQQQERAGLKSITDGEFRRDYWHLDFLSGFDGIDVVDRYYKHAFSGGAQVATPFTARKITKHDGSMRSHYAFVHEASSKTAKICIPGPGMTHLRGGRQGVSEDVYPDLDEFWLDLTSAYIQEVQAFGELGCSYLQFDDVSFAYFCDEDFRAQVTAGGDNPDALLLTYSKVTSAIAAARPQGMTITVHMCRGNNKSTWMTSGGYERVAEIMFAHLDVDGYFMEFDSDRAGGFEPLRFVPDGKKVVLGLVTSKTPELESKDAIKRRIEAASKFVDIDNMCISPQCGFASTHEGNKLSEEEQYRKLELVVEVADEVWS